MSTLINRDLVTLDADLGGTREQVIRALAGLVADAGRAVETESLFADAWAREQKTDTGVPGGIAIPHCRSTSVLEPTLAMARLKPPVDFGAFDGPADLVFFIAAPSGAGELHLALLAKLARSLIDEGFTAALRAAETPDRIVELVDQATSDEPAEARAENAAAATTTSESSDRPVLVGVTSCATGIAHTYMAADALTNAAKKLGVDLHIETQGSAGSTPLDPTLIQRAGAVIFANDVDVRDRNRFAGKPVIQAPVKRGIDHPEDMVREALAAASDPNATRVQGAAAASGSSTGPRPGESVGATIKRVLLTGVSYMIPFVAAGGLLIALGFLFGGYGIALGSKAADAGGANNAVYTLTHYTLLSLPPQGFFYYIGAVLFQIGGLSFGFLVPALAGYIAYAIADRPGIAPGFVVGAVSGFLGAGFLGGIVGGFLAGYTALLIGRPAVPRWLRGLMPVVIIPLLASIVSSGLMILVLGGPIAGITKALTSYLNGLNGAGAIVLGIVLGLMMCFDLGGPVNKTAYVFATTGLAAGGAGSFRIMAAVMAAGMVPPIAMALASTVLYRRGFTEVERENGVAAWLLGASFISEGAIPFAAADPLRVIPASMVGGAVTGALSMGLGLQSRAPHGGIFVFFAIGPSFLLSFLLWFLTIVVGAVITAFVLIALKRFVRPGAQVTEEPDPAHANQPVAVAA
jgi:PTS system fructose-specific IIC component